MGIKHHNYVIAIGFSVNSCKSVQIAVDTNNVKLGSLFSYFKYAGSYSEFKYLQIVIFEDRTNCTEILSTIKAEKERRTLNFIFSDNYLEIKDMRHYFCRIYL